MKGTRNGAQQEKTATTKIKKQQTIDYLSGSTVKKFKTKGKAKGREECGDCC